jgi:hypothetical protein
MSQALATYLHDHLAGSHFAIDLVEHLRDQHAGEPLGYFATTLLVDIQEDQKVLQSVIDRVGKDVPVLKEATAWLSEKFSQLKLRRGAADGLGAVEALETLALGILGKRSLWRALKVVGETDVNLREIDFDHLIERAESQHNSVEEQRLQEARVVFGSGTRSSAN